MKKIILDLIADDDKIKIGQSPYNVSNMEKLKEKCHVHSSDNILLSYDSTVFGTSKKGFILTDQGICTPEWFLSWRKFINYTIKKETGSNIVFTGKDSLTLYALSVVDDIYELLVKIRKALDAKVAAEPLFTFDFKKVIMPFIFGNEAISKYVYSNGIANAAKFHTQLNIHYGEEILLSYDTTVLGNSKVGFLLTERGIYQRETMSSPTFLSWEDFTAATSIGLGNDHNHLKISLKDAAEYSIYLFNQKGEFEKFFKDVLEALKKEYK